MASYQIIETDLNQLKDQVEFVMKAIRVAQPSALVGAPPRVVSLFDLYIESKKAGLVIVNDPAPAAETEDARE